jgi:integrase
VRPGELRSAEWKEFNLEKRLWTVPAEKTKMRRQHRVPLTDQVVHLLGELQPLGRYLFQIARVARHRHPRAPCRKPDTPGKHRIQRSARATTRFTPQPEMPLENFAGEAEHAQIVIRIDAVPGPSGDSV